MTASELNAVLNELEDRDVLVSDYRETFGSVSFDEVLEAVNIDSEN